MVRITWEQAHFHYDLAHNLRYAFAGISLIVNSLTMVLIVKMKVYKNRLMAIVFWMNMFQLAYDTSLLPICGNPPHVGTFEVTDEVRNPVAEREILEDYIDCRTAAMFLLITAGIAIGACTNLISGLVAYVITTGRPLQISQGWIIFLILIPALSLAMLLSQEYRQVHLDDLRDGSYFATLLDTYDAIQLGNTTVNFFAIALIANRLSNLGYESVFGCRIFSCCRESTTKKDNPKTTTLTTRRASTTQSHEIDRTNMPLSDGRGPSVINLQSSLASSTDKGGYGNDRFRMEQHSSGPAPPGEPYGGTRADGAGRASKQPQPRLKSITKLRIGHHAQGEKYVKQAPLPLFDLARRLIWYPIVGSLACVGSTLYHITQRSSIDQYIKTVVKTDKAIVQTVEFYSLAIILPLCGIGYGFVFLFVQRGAWTELKSLIWYAYCVIRYCGKIPPEITFAVNDPDDSDQKAGEKLGRKRPRLIRKVTIRREHRKSETQVEESVGSSSRGFPSTKSNSSAFDAYENKATDASAIDDRDSTASASYRSSDSFRPNNRLPSVRFETNDCNYFDSNYSSQMENDGYDYEYSEEGYDNEYYSEEEEEVEVLYWDFDNVDDLESYIEEAAASTDKVNSSSDMNVDIELAKVTNAMVESAGDQVIPDIPVERGPPSASPTSKVENVEYGSTNPIYNVAAPTDK